MSILAEMAAMQAAKRTQRGNTDIATGNISVRLDDIDRKHPTYGWLMKGTILGGTRGLGQEINFVVPKEALEKIKESNLGPKVKKGAVLRLQDVKAPMGSGTPEKPVAVRRMTGLNLEGRGKTHYNAAIRISMFGSGAYQATIADMDSKTRIDSIAALKERVMADLEEGKSTVFIGNINGNIITGEAYRGQIRNEANENVPEDVAVSWDRFQKRLFDGLDLENPEVTEAVDADLAANEIGFSAYSATNVGIIGKTKSVMEKKLLEGGRPSAIPIDEMFPRSISDRFGAALNQISDREVEVLTAQFAEWSEEKLSDEEKEAYAAGGFAEVSESNLAKFLVQSGVELPNRASGQATSWGAAKERLANTRATSVRTGWIKGDVTTDNHVNGGTEQLDFEYVGTINVHQGGKRTATPFFPDEAAKEVNQTYIYGLTDRLKAFIADPEAHKAAAAAAAEARKAARNPGGAAPAAEAPEAEGKTQEQVDEKEMAADPEPANTISEADIGAAIADNLGGFDIDD
mgnify:CR=1 FL=1